MLLGYDLPGRRARPGEAIPLSLYWQALTRMPETYVVFNRLLDRQQQPWGGDDRWPHPLQIDKDQNLHSLIRLINCIMRGITWPCSEHEPKKIKKRLG